MAAYNEHKLRELFMTLDVSGDAILSFGELYRGLNNSEVDWEGCGLDRATTVHRLWTAADTNGDQQVTFQEFWLMVTAERTPVEAEVSKVRAMFEAMDTSGDGLLSRLEIQQGLANPEIDWGMLGIDENTYDAFIFAQADQDGSNRITFDEFFAFAQKQVSRVAEERAKVTAELVSLVDVSKWVAADVGDWVEDIGLPQYRVCFEANGFTGPKLLQLTMDTLPRMKIHQFEHMKHIMRELRALKGQDAEAVETVADHYRRQQFGANQAAVPGHDLRFGTYDAFQAEQDAIREAKSTLAIGARF
mmetsp:Transcript_26582/g.87139  ORF Transcript_26582/g.87139 Transcript_26582/m.87139 type:complete len:303 (+) Transcript_26582:87-995(+)